MEQERMSEQLEHDRDSTGTIPRVLYENSGRLMDRQSLALDLFLVVWNTVSWKGPPRIISPVHLWEGSAA